MDGIDQATPDLVAGREVIAPLGDDHCSIPFLLTNYPLTPMILNLCALLPIPIGFVFTLTGGFPGLLLGLALIGLGFSNFNSMCNEGSSSDDY